MLKDVLYYLARYDYEAEQKPRMTKNYMGAKAKTF
jgi:hypothetical protein